jgi:hypothetical protein
MVRRWVAQSVFCLTTDWTTGVRSPAEVNDILPACVQTSPETHTAYYPMCTGVHFPRVSVAGT